MRKQTVALTAALSIFGLLLLGCAIPSNDTGTGTGNNNPPVQQDSTAQPAPNATDTGSLEGKFDYSTMNQYVDEVVQDFIDPWMQQDWPQARIPQVLFVASGQQGDEGCMDANGSPGEYSSESYEFCAADMDVYVGQDAVWEFYSQTGDAGPAMGLAHEFGHDIQYNLGLPEPQTSAESVSYENQADCLAGTWAQWANGKGYLETAQNSPNGRSDLDDIDKLFPLIASAEGPDRDHGTLDERKAAFTAGFQSGPSACGINA
jgi:predicted metalloprotease